MRRWMMMHFSIQPVGPRERAIRCGNAKGLCRFFCTTTTLLYRTCFTYKRSAKIRQEPAVRD